MARKKTIYLTPEVAGVNLDEIMSRITKIRELATRGGTQHEAEVAAGKMAELLLKYDLTMAEIDAHVESSARSVTEDTFEFRANRWRQDLLYRVAEAHLCRAIRFTGYQAQGKSHWCRMMVVGHDHNLIVVRETWEWLQVECLRLCGAAFKAAVDSSDTGALLKPEGWRRGFHYGFVTGIADSYRAMRTRVEAEVTAEQWAMVPVLENEVQLRWDELFPKTGDMGKAQPVQRSAFDQGREAGRGVNLGRQVAGQGGELALVG